MERLEATRDREELSKDRVEVVEVAERMKAEHDGACERYHKVLSSTRQIGRARDERKGKTVEQLTKLRVLYKEGQKVAALAQAADVAELRRRVTWLEGDLEAKILPLKTLPGLAEENATLRLKVERMRTATTHLQSESHAVFMVTDQIRVLCDNMEGAMTEETNPKQQELELKAKLRQNSKYATAAGVRKEMGKKELAIVKG